MTTDLPESTTMTRLELIQWAVDTGKARTKTRARGWGVEYLRTLKCLDERHEKLMRKVDEFFETSLY